MGLDDPTKKMSKSAGSENSYIAVMDPPDVIRRKIRRAVTDSGSEVRGGPDKPALTNLLDIYSALAGEPVGRDRASATRARATPTSRPTSARSSSSALAPIQARITRARGRQELHARGAQRRRRARRSHRRAHARQGPRARRARAAPVALPSRPTEEPVASTTDRYRQHPQRPLGRAVPQPGRGRREARVRPHQPLRGHGGRRLPLDVRRRVQRHRPRRHVVRVASCRRRAPLRARQVRDVRGGADRRAAGLRRLHRRQGRHRQPVRPGRPHRRHGRRPSPS